MSFTAEKHHICMIMVMDLGSLERLDAAKGITKENTPLDVYVMAGSEYLRMKNRLCMGLREIQEQAERI